MVGLMESLKRNGLIHPICLEKGKDENGVEQHYLVAGERRYRAAMMAGWPTIPFVYRQQLNEWERVALEAEENLRREKLSWPEQCELIRQMDEANRKLYGSKGPGLNTSEEAWGIEKTAEKAGVSPSTASQQINMAKLFQKRPDLKAKVAHLPFMAAIREVKNIQAIEHTTKLHSEGKIQLSNDIKLGSCLDLIKELPDASIHCVITDPPFGNAQIEDTEGTTRGENLSYTGVLEPSDNLSLEAAIGLVEQLAPQLYRVLRPGGYFYVFHSSDLYEPLRRSFSAAGFYVDPTPIVWYKGRTTTIFTGYNYQSSYEPILYGYKPIEGAKARRLNKGIGNMIEVPSLHASKKTHPFEKPHQLIKLLIENSTIIGETVLDPFSGSGKTVLSARACGRSAIGFELSEKNFVRSQGRLLTGETLEEAEPKKKGKKS